MARVTVGSEKNRHEVVQFVEKIIESLLPADLLKIHHNDRVKK